MARPKKCKRICQMPRVTAFCSMSGTEERIVLSLEEYETIRLIDGENLNQVECAERMEVSRPTVQILYARARWKIAHFLTNGGELKITGGNFRVCEHRGKCRCNGACMSRGRAEESL